MTANRALDDTFVIDSHVFFMSMRPADTCSA